MRCREISRWYPDGLKSSGGFFWEVFSFILGLAVCCFCWTICKYSGLILVQFSRWCRSDDFGGLLRFDMVPSNDGVGTITEIVAVYQSKIK